jgi:cytochrome c
MNKIIVSIVLAVILVLVINKITDVIYYVEKPEKSAYQVETIATGNTTTTEKNSEDAVSGNIMTLFASTSAADGAKVFKKCAACHSINQGGSNKIGPALWGVLGRKAGSISDYKYSKAMAAYEFCRFKK